MNLVFCQESLAHLSLWFVFMASFDQKDFVECISWRRYQGLSLTRKLRLLRIQPLSYYPPKVKVYHVCQLLAVGMDN